MRDLIKFFLLGLIFLFSPIVFSAEQYKVVILPDNIVTDAEMIDSYIYNQTAEFFASEVINILNQTEYIKSPTVSEERSLLKNNPSSIIYTRNLTNKFKNSYNVDFNNLKKVAAKLNSQYILLLTTTVDAENYIMRRTVWDFLNIAGASVIDPAYKLNTYAVLVDTKNNTVLWSQTFYKTISACENRIITRGPSPQTVQLEKIRDYSRMICPEIAQNVQINVLPPDVYNSESKQVYYDMANFDNIFTKKYRRWHKEGSKDFRAFKANNGAKIKKIKKNRQQKRIEKARIKAEQQAQREAQLEVIAEPVKIQSTIEKPVIEKSVIEKPVIKTPIKETKIQNIKSYVQSDYDGIDIKKTRRNNLFGKYDSDRPKLRDYDSL